MNKRQLIILWAIALVLAASVAAVKFTGGRNSQTTTARKPGETLLASFSPSGIASIELKGAADATTLVLKDGKWVVSQRGDYPANVPQVNELLRTIAEVKVTQGMQAGPSFAPRFGMDEAATTDKDRGITATFKDASGKELAKVTVGKQIESAGSQASPMGGGATGRFVRNHADDSGFYSVSEMFSSLSDVPARWLAQEFFTTEKVRSVSVTQPGKDEIAWKASRPREDAEMVLEGAAAGETLDPTAAGALRSLFAYSRFDDVVPAAEVEGKAVPDQKRVAVVTTFDGLVYKITFTPAKKGPAPVTTDPANPIPSPEESVLVTVEAGGELAKERKKADGEKPEDAKGKDDVFAAQLKVLEERLASDKKLAGYTFQVGKNAFETLLKSRADLLKKPEDAAPPSAGVPGMPTFRVPAGGISPGGAPIEATTPPVSVEPPPAPEPEKK